MIAHLLALGRRMIANPFALGLRLVKTAAALFGLFIVGLTAVNAYELWLDPGPAQPIPFSHRLHATDKRLSCLFCHPSVTTSDHPGLPSVEKCLLCHDVIAKDFPPIAKIRGYFDRREPIPWKRVFVLPDYVYFSHQAHLAGRIDCGECHGNVKMRDRLKMIPRIDMGFCVDCHKKYGTSRDCTICHR